MSRRPMCQARLSKGKHGYRFYTAIKKSTLLDSPSTLSRRKMESEIGFTDVLAYTVPPTSSPSTASPYPLHSSPNTTSGQSPTLPSPPLNPLLPSHSQFPPTNPL